MANKNARALRKNLTPQEVIVWVKLRELKPLGFHFRRQAPIGRYVVDFFCPAAHLIVELDGGHHNEDDTAERDGLRQRWLENEGYRVIRFWNNDVMGNIDGVIAVIADHLPDDMRGAARG